MRLENPPGDEEAKARARSLTTTAASTVGAEEQTLLFVRDPWTTVSYQHARHAVVPFDLHPHSRRFGCVGEAVSHHVRDRAPKMTGIGKHEYPIRCHDRDTIGV